MAVRFVIGRAGSGKTYHCVESVRERLRVDAVNGPRLLLLVPEQAGLQTELAVLGSADIPGAHRLDVVSFQRLARRVLAAAGPSIAQPLSESARVMVIRHLAGLRAADLQYYRKVERHIGFAQQIGRTFTEFIQEAITPDDLDLAAAAQLEIDNATQAKLHDVRLLYAAYLDYLGDERVDPSQFLEQARALFHTVTWLDNAELWVDGFASLSEQEVLSLIELAKRCRHVDFTMMMDPQRARPASGQEDPDEQLGLFRKPARTWRTLSQRFTDAGLEVVEPLRLARRPLPRFDGNPALDRLEEALFQPDHAESADGASSSDGIRIVELPTRRLEVEFAVAQICEWSRRAQNPYRYRDMALIVRDLELYHDLLRDSLDAKGIPYFVDRRRQVTHHPLVRLLCAGVGLIANRSSLQSVQALIKTGMLPIPNTALDEFENYLIAYGIHGAAYWDDEGWTATGRLPYRQKEGESASPQVVDALSRINDARRSFRELGQAWVAFGSEGSVRTCCEWVAAIRAWFDKLEAGGTLRRWRQAALADGDTDAAAEHEQVWRDVQTFLDDFESAFEDTPLSVDELFACLEQGLNDLTLGLVPPMIDQLLVGAVERSRHPTMKGAVILGCNDGVFPGSLREDAILNDDDRRLMREAGLPVAEPARDRIPDESTLFYIAATRASEQVLFTYAGADEAGKKLRPSPYLREVQRACRGVVTTVASDPQATRDGWEVQTHGDLIARLAMEFRQRPNRDQDRSTHRATWNELYESIRDGLAEDDNSRFALSALADAKPARLSKDSVDKLLRLPLRTSVSQLETYAACPFQHFAKYSLKLRERVEAELAPVDVGQVHHAILEEFVRELADKGGALGDLADDELRQSLQRSCDRVTKRMPVLGEFSSARDAYILSRSASRLGRILAAQRTAGRLGRLRPHGAEVPFGFDEPNSLPALNITTPAGNQILLRGYIDRVDLAELQDEFLGVVVDYKLTRDKKVDMSWVYHGLSLQLISYLLVLAKHGQTLAGRPIRPGAAFYVSLAQQYETVEHPGEPAEPPAMDRGVFAPRGLIGQESIPALDAALETGRSDAYSIYLKKDGTLGHVDKIDVLPDADFQRVLNHTEHRIANLADELIDGNIKVAPFSLKNHTPCGWCPMNSVCRYEMGLSDTRFLESLKRQDLLDRMADHPSSS